MDVAHEEQGHRGAFFIEREGKRLGELTYTVAGSRVILDHTTWTTRCAERALAIDW